MNAKNPIGRRDFMRAVAAGCAALMLPNVTTASEGTGYDMAPDVMFTRGGGAANDACRDDAPALQAMIDAAWKKGEKVFTCPPGTYHLHTMLHVPAFTTFRLKPGTELIGWLRLKCSVTIPRG